MLKDIGFYHLRENIEKQLLDTGVGAVKTSSKEVVHKTDEFIGNKIADAVPKSNNDKIEKQEPVQGIIIPLEKEMKY